MLDLDAIAHATSVMLSVEQLRLDGHLLAAVEVPPALLPHLESPDLVFRAHARGDGLAYYYGPGEVQIGISRPA